MEKMFCRFRGLWGERVTVVGKKRNTFSFFEKWISSLHYVRRNAFRFKTPERKALVLFALILICLSTLNFLFVLGARAQSASDLIISEYIEGSSYHKAIEVFNGTEAPLDLSLYSLEKDSNGNGEFGSTYYLSGTLEAGKVFVLAHSKADQQILEIADERGSGVANFNGNDQIRLLKNDEEIDRIGVGGDIDFGKDVTYVRNEGITTPQSGEQDPRSNGEWTTYENNTFAYLGSHAGSTSEPVVDAVVCGNGILELENEETCDDGGLLEGDGCSASCLFETETSCSEIPFERTCIGIGLCEWHDEGCQEHEPIREEEDTDQDGIPDESDNCPIDANTDQEDSDLNGIGDVCEVVEEPTDEDLIRDPDSIKELTFDGMVGLFNGEIFSQMTQANIAEESEIKTFLPIQAWPMDQTAGKTTNYYISFPTTHLMATGDLIQLTFPDSFDLTHAALATDAHNKLVFSNQDINGPGGILLSGNTVFSEGRVQISTIIADNQTKSILLTLIIEDGKGCTLDATGALSANCTDENTQTTTMPYDFLTFELSGIKNGESAQHDWQNNSGGYQVEILTKKATGQPLEGPISSMRFDIKAVGSGTISGKITEADGLTPISGAQILLQSSLTGSLEMETDVHGDYTFSQLPLSEGRSSWGAYHLKVAPPQDSDYYGEQQFNVQLSSENTDSTGNDMFLSTATNTITFLIHHEGDTLEAQEVSIWASGSGGRKEQLVTLEAEGSTQATLKVGSGMWDFGVTPQSEESFFNKKSASDFMPSKPVQKNIAGPATVTFYLDSSDIILSGKVTDGTAGLANVNVYAYQASGDGRAVHGTTASDGSYQLKVPSGTYLMGAFKSGLAAIPEKTIEGTSNTNGVDFQLQRSESTITGVVTDGLNTVPSASVNAWSEEGGWVTAMTDEQGGYTLFVEPGIWNVEVALSEYGELEPEEGVTTKNIAITSGASQTGINFSVASSTYYLISGQVKDDSAKGISNVFIFATEINTSDEMRGAVTGNEKSSKTDRNGTFSIKVKPNATENQYQIHAWHPEYGTLKPINEDLISITSENSTGNDFYIKKQTIHISIINGEALERGNVDMANADVEIFSTTNQLSTYKKFKAIDLIDGEALGVGTISIQEGDGYAAIMHIPGVGKFVGTLNGEASFDLQDEETILFDLDMADEDTVLTFSGTVKEAALGVVEGAWVNVQHVETLETFGVFSSAEGTYSIKVPTGTYQLRVDKPGYKSPDSETITTNDSARTLIMTASGSTITGSVLGDDGETVAYPFVWAEELNGEGWAGAEVDQNGEYAIPVPDGTIWNIFAKNGKGLHGLVSNIVAGETEQNIILNSTSASAHFITNEPKVEPITPSVGGRFDDTDNTGVKLNIPANALGTGDYSGQIKVIETAAISGTSKAQPLGGIGKDITATDRNGQPVTHFNSDITIELVYKKSEIEVFTEADNRKDLNGLAVLNNLQNAYWDSAIQNWNAMSTIKNVQVKNSTTDDWTPVEWDDFISNIQGEGDNSGAGGGSQKDYYFDYKLELVSITDHFTIFGAITVVDSIPPGSPTGIAVSAENGSIAIDWADNTEVDWLEYQVFRGDTAAFSCDDSTQVNTESVRSSAFIDTTITENASYASYYKMTAVDDSGNISSCSEAVFANYTYVPPVVVTPLAPDPEPTPVKKASSSGGGGNGRSIFNDSPNTTAPHFLPIGPSNTEYYSLRPVSLGQTKGKVTRPLKLENFYEQLSVVVPKGSVIKEASGNPFTGTLTIPTQLKASQLPELEKGYEVWKGVQVGAKEPQSIVFSAPFVLTIPIIGVSNAKAKRLKVYYYNPEQGQVTLVGNGGQLAPDRGAITVQGGHMSMFLVVDTRGDDFTFAKVQGKNTVEVPRNFQRSLSGKPPSRSLSTRSTTPFTDMVGHWASHYVKQLREQGVVSGKRPNEFEPNSPLTRAELTKIVIKAFDLGHADQVIKKPFKDVESKIWYASYIAAAQQYKIIDGYSDGTFRPNNFVSRLEALKIVLETSGLDILGATPMSFLDVESGSWYEKYINFAVGKGLIDGYRGGQFHPDENITRAEMARAIVEIWNLMMY